MVYKIADNITSPIGRTTEENYQAVKNGRTALAYYDGQWDIPEPFTAAIFSDLENAELSQAGLTRFESLVYTSVQKALEDTSVNVSNDRVVFILSTTKGNVDLLGEKDIPPAILHPGESARRISKALGIKSLPIVVCAYRSLQRLHIRSLCYHSGRTAVGAASIRLCYCVWGGCIEPIRDFWISVF